MTAPLRVFLCHSSDDKNVVARLATDLKQNGVEVWYDDWRIGLGDSLRRKIDQGISEATHFVAVLSATALSSEWVHTELDGAMVRRIEGECRLIPALLGLAAKEIPPTLRGLKWVRLDPYEDGLEQLLKTFHGRTEEPSLGLVPDRFARVLGPDLGFSPDAQRVARFVCERASNGHPATIVSFDEIVAATKLSDADLVLALDELVEEGLLNAEGSRSRVARPEWELFFQVDPVVHGWDPEQDALAVASELANATQFRTADLASRLGWEPRRMNPACGFLANRDIVRYRQFMGGGPFYYGNLITTPRTLRFVRDSN